MANSSVQSIVVLLAAVAAVSAVSGPARARPDTTATSAIPRWLDQTTVYRPNCPRVEYDEVCLFDGCAADCRGR